ncbi:MAG TPA: hypothetical protein VJQ58_05710 [Burkholderiales bacterium]|nr:hypothetical protein [Burkholderiales bacterium]
MSRHNPDRVNRVIAGALRLWGVTGRIELQIIPVEPRGWLVLRDGQLVASHAGLPGLLRTLREELAPGSARGRLIIGPQSFL